MRAEMAQNQVNSVDGGEANQVPEAKVQKLSQTQINNELEIENEQEVKKEIRKILLTILVLVLIIVAVYFINIKTDLILKAGQFVSSKLNLSI